MGSYYSFTCKNPDSLQLEERQGYYRLAYSYFVGDDHYNNVEEVSTDRFKPKGDSSVIICYNDSFPSLSYLKEVNLSLVRAKTSIVISLFFILFITAIYFLTKRDHSS